MFSPLSSRYLSTVRDSYTMRTKVEVYRSNAQVTGIEFPVAGGEIRGDRVGDIRRTLDITFADDDEGTLVPILKTDPLRPNGVEILVYQGPQYADGTVEWIPVGRFRITRTNSKRGSVRCTGSDLGYTLRTPLDAPLYIPSGTEIGAAILQIVQAKNPALDVSIVDTGLTTPSMLIDFQDIPLKQIRAMAQAAGCDARFDGVGRLIVEDLVTRPTNSPAVRFVEGLSEDVQFWAEEREVDSEGVPSVMVVEANSPALTAPLRVAVYDTNPNSPTYAYGPYGKVVQTVSTEKVGSIAQARVFGRTELARKAWAERFYWECLPLGALSEGDTVALTRTKLGLDNEPCIVESFSLPLMPGPMRIVGSSRIQPEYTELTS